MAAHIPLKRPGAGRFRGPTGCSTWSITKTVFFFFPGALGFVSLCCHDSFVGENGGGAVGEGGDAQVGAPVGVASGALCVGNWENQEWMVLLEIVVLDLAIVWELEACHWEVHQLLERHCVGPLL